MSDTLSVGSGDPRVLVLPDSGPGIRLNAHGVVPCVYCRYEVPTGNFVYVSPDKRLLAGTCPGCDRRMTLARSTWERWTVVPVTVS